MALFLFVLLKVQPSLVPLMMQDNDDYNDEDELSPTSITAKQQWMKRNKRETRKSINIYL